MTDSTPIAAPAAPPAPLRLRPTVVPQNLEWFCESQTHLVMFHHPGYPLGQDILLTLYGFDHDHGGLHVGTALIACGIVSGNRWDGYLTETRRGPPLQMDPEEILKKNDYYFHVPGPEEDSGPGTEQPYRYPVWPSFRHWLFPHDDLPPLWLIQPSSTSSLAPVTSVGPSNVSAAVIQRDGSCCVSSHRGYAERAHLVPRSESDWFHANQMRRYNTNLLLTGDQITDDINNAIALRSDLHTCFDEKRFVFIPKQSRWTVHFLQPTDELGRMYHNTVTELDPKISHALLFARFAYAIFAGIIAFIQTGPARTVCIPTADVDSVKPDIRVLSRDELGKLIEGAQTKSSSPRKRKAPDVDPSTANESESRTFKRRRSYSLTSESTTSESSSAEPDHGGDGRMNRFERIWWTRRQLNDSGFGDDETELARRNRSDETKVQVIQSDSVVGATIRHSKSR